ncbi:very-short-patch mismatch repair endonuclease (g-t specific) [hydrocarbon metagenome]|uniref:Very-short-patch mismatch repair endonuclease (G-t specific) n=1 Tax=hydrocarbon metagenome TaxID=938273 RepID=A0A0W8FSG6_9ZZZZ
MDKISKEARSRNMAAIKGKNTKPEIAVRKFLHSLGYRYRLHGKDLPGKPDIVLPKYKTVIFVHGCFWHGHTNCRYFVIPKTRTEWWKEKIERNKQLDDENSEKLKGMGWKIITIFECKLRSKFRNKTLQLLTTRLVK